MQFRVCTLELLYLFDKFAHTTIIQQGRRRFVAEFIYLFPIYPGGKGAAMQHQIPKKYIP